jgi:hypothetical protein
VDGPVEEAPKLASWKDRRAGNRTIHAKFNNMHSETPFLEYRLQVVSSWPESDRKRATIEAILSQMEREGGRDPGNWPVK